MFSSFFTPLSCHTGEFMVNATTILCLSPEEFDKPRAVDAFIDHVDEVFHLVMINEYMLESLILLKDLLCWSLEDVVMLAKNFRNKSAIESLLPTTINQVYRLCIADFRLYVYFKSRLMQKIRDYGEKRMVDEVRQLKYLIGEIQKRCEIDEIPQQFMAPSSRIEEYQTNTQVHLPSNNVTNDRDCVLWTMDEISFTDELRKIHKRRLANEQCDP